MQLQEILKEILARLKEILARIRSTPVPDNEESAKFKIIAPILQSLGWDTSGPQVLLEHSVGDKKAGGRVDIALKGSRGVVALIEAKAPGVDLNGHVSQVLGYAFHEGVDICVLTTGVEWWLYLPREQGQPEQRRFAVLNIIEDPVDELADDLRAFLSRHALEASDAVLSDAVLKAKRVLRAQHDSALISEKIPSIWRKMIEEPDEELVEVVSRRVYSEINLRPNTEQVVAVLKGRMVTTPPKPPKGGELESSPSKSSKPGLRPGNPGPTGHRPTAIVMFGVRYRVKTNAESLVRVAEVLLERHPDKFARISEGSEFCSSRGRVYVSRDPEQMTSPRQVGTSGHFVETNFSAQKTQDVARQLLRRFDYSDSDLDFKYE